MSLIERIKKLKKEGKKIVSVSGSFDVLHSGHIDLLQKAKKQGDVLVVLLNSDRSIRAYKGPGRPINSQKDRAKILAAIKYVNYIIIFNEITPEKILDKIKPDIFFQGRDWGKNCIEKRIVEKNGGKIYLRKKSSSSIFSSSDLIKRILNNYSAPVSKAVFLDRDGTINVNNPEYTSRIEDFKFFPESITALKKLSKGSFKIIIITNQSGIGRGYFKEKDLKKLHNWMVKELKKKGIRIDKIYYCPHKPSDNCLCRKPKPGMIMKAVKDFNLSLNESWLAGDGENDVILGRKTNLKTIKIGKKMPKELKIEPNYHAKNLLEAVNIILKNEK